MTLMLFFPLFQHVADAKNWPESDRVLMLSVCPHWDSAVCGEDGSDYEAVKASVLKANDLVPEAYRQKV